MANSGTNNGAVTVTDAATSRTNLGVGAAALLASPVTVSNGGFGYTSLTDAAIWVGNGTSAIQQLVPSANGQILIGATSAVPAWGSPTCPDGTMTFTLGLGALTIQTVSSTTSQLGNLQLATAAQAQSGSSSTLGLTPSTLTSALAVPGATGGTTPAQGTFTTITLTTTSGPQINTGSGAPSASLPKASMYMRTDGTTTNDRAYIATDTLGTYTAFVTVA